MPSPKRWREEERPKHLTSVSAGNGNMSMNDDYDYYFRSLSLNIIQVNIGY